MSDLAASLDVRRDGFHLRLDLAVPSGRVVALLGRNGAGKSTALAAVAGVLAEPAGRVAVGGVVLEDAGVFVPPERRRIGLVQQQPALFPHRTVLDNVGYGMLRAGRRLGARRLLAEAGLADLADRRPASLSGGQAARVALVRTLAREPALLLLDEPMAAIDAEGRPALRDTIRQALGRFSGAAVLVTHDVADVEALADEVVVLDAGAVVQRGPLAHLRASPASDIVARLVSASHREQ